MYCVKMSKTLTDAQSESGTLTRSLNTPDAKPKLLFTIQTQDLKRFHVRFKARNLFS